MHGGSFPRDAGGASVATRPGGGSMTSLAALSSSMREHVEVRDRRYRMRTYKSCFLGSAAVAWLVDAGHAETVSGAISLGNRMIRDGLFRHVAGEHLLEDAKLFYRFEVDERAKRSPGQSKSVPSRSKKIPGRCRHAAAKCGRTSGTRPIVELHSPGKDRNKKVPSLTTFASIVRTAVTFHSNPHGRRVRGCGATGSCGKNRACPSDCQGRLS